MGTTPSPWRYDVGAPPSAPVAEIATACDSVLPVDPDLTPTFSPKRTGKARVARRTPRVAARGHQVDYFRAFEAPAATSAFRRNCAVLYT
jgi:hypothetical protein